LGFVGYNWAGTPDATVNFLVIDRYVGRAFRISGAGRGPRGHRLVFGPAPNAADSRVGIGGTMDRVIGVNFFHDRSAVLFSRRSLASVSARRTVSPGGTARATAVSQRPLTDMSFA